MKRFLKPVYLPLAALTFGVITLLFRLWFLALGVDDRGLLPVGSIPDVLSWVMVALVMAILAAGTWNLKGANKYSYNFSPSDIAGIATALAGISFLITSVTELIVGADSISITSAILGFLAAASLCFLGYCRWKGRRPSMVFHGIVCLYLMLYLISHYRLWSSAPQLQSYGFELLAIVFVMLACYQRAAFDADRGNRRSYAFFSLAALYFSIATLPGCDNYGFFIGCAIWMAATPCRLTVRRSVPKED